MTSCFHTQCCPSDTVQRLVELHYSYMNVRLSLHIDAPLELDSLEMLDSSNARLSCTIIIILCWTSLIILATCMYYLILCLQRFLIKHAKPKVQIPMNTTTAPIVVPTIIAELDLIEEI